MPQAAIIIPFDPMNRTYMVVRSTNWHPVAAFRHKLKGVGGIVEEGEAPEVAVLRELDEEQPGWFARVPGTGKRWGEPGTQVAAVNNLHKAGEATAKDIVWHVYLAPTDLGLHSFRKARSVATESTPEVWSLDAIPAEEDCLPGFRDAILLARRTIFAAYPSMGFNPA